MIEISVIIPTVNRAHLLNRTLKSLLDQSYPQEKFEVLIIDNGSVDETPSVVAEYQNRFKNFRYFYDKSPGLHVGRHVGMKNANGALLTFVDDDIKAFPSWLSGIAESFIDTSIALVGGNNLPEYETEPPGWVDLLWSKTEWGLANSIYSVLNFGDTPQIISPYYVWGCNFSIRKSVLIQVGGFHPDGMPSNLLRFRGDGETAVSQAILDNGYKVLFNPKASIYHWVSGERMTLDYIYRRGYIQGISDSYTYARQAGGISFRQKILSCVISLKQKLYYSFSAKLNPWTFFHQGYVDGYRYHLKEMDKDKKLEEWVLKKNYF